MARLARILGIVLLGALLARAAPVQAQCPGGAAAGSWPCTSLSGSAAQPTDLLLGFRPSLGTSGQGALSVLQVLNDLTTLQVTTALGYTPVNPSGSAITGATITASTLVSPTLSGTMTGGAWVPLIPGCYGDGTHDDTACVQAAITANARGTLYLGPHIYAIDATGITCAAPIDIVGTQGNQGSATPYQTFSGFRPLAVNQTVLTVAPACNGSIFEKFSFDMGAPGTNTSGAAISMGATDANDTFRDIAINAPCDGMLVNGNTIIIDHAQITRVSGSGCVGMTLGGATTGATTIATVENTTIQSVFVPPAGEGMYIADCGGCVFQGNDILFSAVGTLIQPGANQQVLFGFFSNTVLGDTTTAQPMIINAGATTGVVRGMQFTGTWTANSINGQSVLVENTGAGTITDIYFLGHRAYASYSNAFDFEAGTNLTVDASHVCGGGSGSSAVYLAAGVSGVHIRDNTDLGGTCAGLTGSFALGVDFAGTNSDVILLGNDMTGPSAPASGTPTGNSSVANNPGLDSLTPTIASASSITFSNPAPMWIVTGTTGVSNIFGAWNARRVTINTPGIVTFSTGGTAGSAICQTYTSAGSTPFTASYYTAGGCWNLW
jgi:hypothetical protein